MNHFHASDFLNPQMRGYVLSAAFEHLGIDGNTISEEKLEAIWNQTVEISADTGVHDIDGRLCYAEENVISAAIMAAQNYLR